MPNASSLEAPSRSSVYTGILPSQKIREMVATRDIKSLEFSEISADQVQPASIDLRLGDFAYRMDASFLPGKGKKVWERMRELDPDFQSYGLDLRKGAVLERGRLYIIPLQESIRLRSGVSAFANPKSSTGRLDILTRLIADEAILFDQVEEGYEGQLYLEVAPRSFSVVARTKPASISCASAAPGARTPSRSVPPSGRCCCRRSRWSTRPTWMTGPPTCPSRST